MEELTPDKATTALVTGGGGFLGHAICKLLRTRGLAVRSFSRQAYSELDDLGVDCICGNLADKDAISSACNGCDVVFHVAAKAGVWGKYEDYYVPNVVGTANIISACRAHSVPRLVYTSSPSVVFNNKPIEGQNESLPYADKKRSNYSQTKAIAEKLVLTANGPALKTIAIRPHLIWGPRDNHIVPRLIAQAKAGKLRIVGDGRNKVDTIYIDNAADAHLLAAEALQTNGDAAGRAFFVSQDEPIAIADIVNGILRAANLPPVTKRIPFTAARIVGMLCEAWYYLLRLQSEPPMTRFVAEQLAKPHWFDISAARTELGYTPRVSITDGLRRLEDWLTTHECQI